MKESSDSSHRKLIRPSLNEVKEQMHQQKRQHQSQNHSRQKRSAPPEQTNAESFYFVKQMQNRTPIVLVLKDRRRTQRHGRVVRQELPEDQPGGRAERAGLQRQHQIHLQAERAKQFERRGLRRKRSWGERLRRQLASRSNEDTCP